MTFTVDCGGEAKEAPREVRQMLSSEIVRRASESISVYCICLIRSPYRKDNQEIKEGYFIAERDSKRPLFLLLSSDGLEYKIVPPEEHSRPRFSHTDHKVNWSLV